MFSPISNKESIVVSCSYHHITVRLCVCVCCVCVCMCACANAERQTSWYFTLLYHIGSAVNTMTAWSVCADTSALTSAPGLRSLQYLHIFRCCFFSSHSAKKKLRSGAWERDYSCGVEPGNGTTAVEWSLGTRLH